MKKTIKLPKGTLELKRGRIEKNLAKTALRAELFRQELKSSNNLNGEPDPDRRDSNETEKDEFERRGASATEREDESTGENPK